MSVWPGGEPEATGCPLPPSTLLGARNLLSVSEPNFLFFREKIFKIKLLYFSLIEIRAERRNVSKMPEGTSSFSGLGFSAGPTCSYGSSSSQAWVLG